MAIRPGGYQTGLTYRQYRAYGHGPLSAWFMKHANIIQWMMLYLLAMLTGFAW